MFTIRLFFCFFFLVFAFPTQIIGKNLRDLGSQEDKNQKDALKTMQTAVQEEGIDMFYNYDRYEQILGLGDEEEIYQTMTSHSSKFMKNKLQKFGIDLS